MARNKQDVGLAVAYFKDRLNSLPEPPQSRSQAPNSKLHIVLNRARYKRATPQILERLDAALVEAGIETHPSLDSPDLTRDTRIYFFDAPKPPGLPGPESFFAKELLFKKFLKDNYQSLKPFKGLTLVDCEYPLEGRKIDMLFEERKAGRRLVGVELKHQGPDAGVVKQMCDYMGALTRKAEKEGRPDGARGMVITGQPDPDLEKELRKSCDRHGYDVSWYHYSLSIELEVAPDWK